MASFTFTLRFTIADVIFTLFPYSKSYLNCITTGVIDR